MVTEEELRAAEWRYEDLLGRVRGAVSAMGTLMAIAKKHGDTKGYAAVAASRAVMRQRVPEAFKEEP